jgi:Ca2+/Na+ antiporter
MVVNTSPEPVTNVAASLAEDGLAVGSVLLAAFYPLVLLIVVVTGLIVSLFLLPRTVRYFRSLLAKLRGKLGTASVE